MQTIRWGAAVAALMVTAAAHAASPCDNPQDQATMNQCAMKDYQASDKKLNTTFQTLNKKLSPQGKAALQKSQRAWIAWRDAQCTFETMGSDGGSIHSLVITSCMDELTKEQTKRLDKMNNCEEGDLSCTRP
ncbi:lysozyme inhibitor LprI family protein [Pandoraea sp. NPDC087047]|uniref:lysozyme inhibitor LprI family protein n=1 Tax=Pandoraea sp. NPDC087047 TaxID=3364390 RepID=UPI00382879DF